MRNLILVLLAALVASASAQTGINVAVPDLRSPQAIALQTDLVVKEFSRRAARLTARPRQRLIQAGRYDPALPFSLPTTVHLTVRGQRLAPYRRDPGPITLVFDASGSRAFPAAFRAHLEATFAAAQATMNVVFGQPSSAGPILVRNYDADIQDRYAVSGGYFLPNNGAGQREIRFPVYGSLEAATVNFVHCLLLAYLGPNAYGFDAFQEGIVRAATMKVVRTPGALPTGMDAGIVEDVLANTYDVGGFYDWYNQRALGGKQFIAPNLLNDPLPAGGSLGGIYLLRYQMAGSAWQKLVAENPGFLAEFNARFYANPGAANDMAQLTALGQAALDAVKGAANSRVEGLTFSDWVRRQYILETQDTLGPKLLVQPIPISSGLFAGDFGVFDVSATYFETRPGGNEILLGGKAFPIFWDRAFDRVFPSTQEDEMNIAAGYGSVTPNLPDLYAGQPYRCTVDIPVLDRIARAYLPAGAIATAANPSPKNFYGTVIGLPAGATVRVRVIIGSSQVADVPVQNGAFGATIASSLFPGYARLRVDVVRVQGSTATMLLQRFVNKGPGPLALDLRIGGDGTFALPGGVLKGIQAFGLPIDPYSSSTSELLAIPDAQLLLARFNAGKVSYDYHPATGALQIGHGYFLRANQAAPLTVAGRGHPGTAVAVACRPGWNLITTPLNETVLTSRVQVVKSFNAPLSFAEALGTDLGTDFFEFVRGANDAVSGAPETGTMVAATSFQPGKAYYVRVLAPEGVTLVFYPSTTPQRPGSPFVPTGWHVRALVRRGNESAAAIIGQTTTATRAMDRREDGLLPPRTGGFQVVIEGAGNLYREMRPLGVAEDRFRLRIEGLQPGKEYIMDIQPQLGTPPRFVLFDNANGVFSYRSAPTQYRFRASGTTHRIELWAVRAW